ncbi:MAG: hypothetical protein C0602_00500 [Denitrovibrio sp.]|nr:MAG: hypothetical protein C0602_00500 [Denitrovibrio sp.]
MENINNHKLKRDIPSGVKREVRQRCGFGCVVCGNAFIEYEHMDPEFKDAVKHDAMCITLLCPTCHGLVSSKFWSKQKIIECDKYPFCKNSNTARSVLSSFSESPTVVFAGIEIRNCKSLINVNDVSILSIKEPEEGSNVYRLSGIFHNSAGNKSLVIVDNEWMINNDNCDVDVSGGCITIREGLRRISLKICIEENNRLVVENIDMSIDGVVLKGGRDELELSINGVKNNIFGGRIENCMCGISLRSV